MTRPSIAAATLLAMFVSISYGDDSQSLPASMDVVPRHFVTGLELADGLAFNREGTLYVANYRHNGSIGRITPDGRASVLCDLATVAPIENGIPRAGGIKVDSEGRLIVADAGAGRLLRIAGDGSSAMVLADRADGQHFFSVLDVALNRRGDIFFSVDSSPSTPTGGAVFWFDIRRNRIERLQDGLARPTGLAVSPDQSRLCVSESERRRVLTYELSELSERSQPSVLFDYAASTNGESSDSATNPEPRGLIFDRDGRLWVAVGEAGRIDVISLSGGGRLASYNAGGKQPTFCHFYGSSLFVAIADKEAAFRLDVGVTGFVYNDR